MKFKRRRKANKQILLTQAFLLLLLFIGIGYSVLGTNLGINGTVQLSKHEEPQYLYNVIKNEAESGTFAKKYTGIVEDSLDTTKNTEDVYYYIGKPDNNVVFGVFCWHMVRTTSTGGVKLIYNGVYTEENKCNNNGEAQQIGKTAFNTSDISPAHVGYMYNPDTLLESKYQNSATVSLYGNGVTYSNGQYTLTDTSTTKDDNHHYTCNNTTGICSEVRYYYYGIYYVELNDGRTIEQALNDMLYADNVNKENSEIKTYIENWYRDNMTDYTSYLEDVIYCNDRSLANTTDYNYQKSGWNPNGGLLVNETGKYNSYLSFKNAHFIIRYDTVNYNPELSCANITDKFAISNNKAKLTYSVMLLTLPEIYLAHDEKTDSDTYSNSYLRTESNYWLGSPSFFYSSSAYMNRVFFPGYTGNYDASVGIGVRPAISLIPRIEYSSGDGSMNNPYVIKLD